MVKFAVTWLQLPFRPVTVYTVVTVGLTVIQDVVATGVVFQV